MTETMGRAEPDAFATPAGVYVRMRQDGGGGGGSIPLQDHIGAVLHRVKSVKHTVSSLQAQQAALAAATDAVAASKLESVPPHPASLIAACQQRLTNGQPEAPTGLLMRQCMQQSSIQHSTQSGNSAGDSKSGSVARTAHAVRLQALLQELAALSADGSSQCTECRSQMALDLGEVLLAAFAEMHLQSVYLYSCCSKSALCSCTRNGVSLQLQPNMRVVFEMGTGDVAANGNSPQPFLTAEACTQLMHASIAAARAAEAAAAAVR